MAAGHRPGTAWIVYGFVEGLLPIAISNLFITPLCAVILTLRVRYRPAPVP